MISHFASGTLSRYNSVLGCSYCETCFVTLQADPDAHAKFVGLTKAYEVLKDTDSRKKYDLYGEEGFKSSQKQSYHSWSYYHDNFGIYDDDPEIVTLNKADFGKYYHNLMAVGLSVESSHVNLEPL
jgi:DnaJ-class molecular chaperone